MSRGPLIFGFPAWTGLTKRIGKRHLGRDWYRFLVAWRDARIGDLYNDCSGLNRRLAAVDPGYKSVGRKKSQVLVDLDLQAEDGSYCSFRWCGVEPPVSCEEAEKRRQQIVHHYLTKGDLQRAREWSPEVTTIHPDGTFSLDHAAWRKVRDEYADRTPHGPGVSQDAE